MLEKYDRMIFLQNMPCIIRFIPSFVKRYNIWDKHITETSECPFCKKICTTQNILFSRFKYIYNDFPFMSNQVTVFNEEHKDTFSKNDLIDMVNIVTTLSECKSGGLQIRGSGASLPNHLHFSISDEEYPIVHLNEQKLMQTEKYYISRFIGLPHLAIKLTGCLDCIADVSIKISEIIKSKNMSYNIIFTKKGEIIIIPRIKENSKLLNRKVGISLVGGIYPCYVKRNFGNKSDNAVIREMLSHWQNISSDMLVKALRETTISSEITKTDIVNMFNLCNSKGCYISEK